MQIPSWAIAFILGVVGNLFFLSVLKAIQVHGMP
jgi:hypothetical protein